MILQHNFVLCQGASFISAQNIHCAKVLNSIQMFDDHFLFRQLYCAARQRRGNNHRQHFRRQAYRDRKRKQCRFPPVAFGVTID